MAEDHRTSVIVSLFLLLPLIFFLIFPPFKFRQEWRIMKTWTVPWSWPIVLIAFFASEMSMWYLFSALYQFGCHYGIVGEVNLPPLAYVAAAKRNLANQIVNTLAQSGILFVVIHSYKPLPDDLFHWDVMEPFNLDHGWIIWTTFGLIAIAAANVVIIGLYFEVDFLSGELQAERMTNNWIFDYFSSFLPPATEASAVSMIHIVTSRVVLASIIEETMYRGFLMASMSNWFPTPVAVMISSFLFSVSPFSPQFFPLIFVSVFGLSYAQTRNLLAPFMIHFLWNLSVILSTFCRVNELRNQDLLISDSV